MWVAWFLLGFFVGVGVGALGHLVIVSIRERRVPDTGEPAKQAEPANVVTVQIETQPTPGETAPRTVGDRTTELVPISSEVSEVRDADDVGGLDSSGSSTTVQWDAEPALVASADHMAWLRGEDGDFLLNLVTNVVGSDEEADVLLDADEVAGRHAVIRTIDGRWWLEPAAPGTILNDEPVKPGRPVALHNGDRVRFGATAELTMFIPSGPKSAPSLELDVAGASATGGRQSNQDSHYCDRYLIVVADGVGGRPAGKLASELTVQTIASAGKNQEFTHTVREVNAVVRTRGKSDPRTDGMATTLDAAVIRADGERYRVHGVHIGDGMALVQRGEQVSVLTRVHTLASELVATGRLSASQSQDHPDAATLLRAVGLDKTISPDLWDEPAEPGSRFLLASDGLLAALGSRRLETELAALREATPKQCAERLVEVALECDAPDNVTVVVGDVVVTGRGRVHVPSRKAFDRGPLDRRLLPPAESTGSR